MKHIAHPALLQNGGFRAGVSSNSTLRSPFARKPVVVDVNTPCRMMPAVGPPLPSDRRGWRGTRSRPPDHLAHHGLELALHGGSRPLLGSSIISNCGWFAKAWITPIFCRFPEDVPNLLVRGWAPRRSPARRRRTSRPSPAQVGEYVSVSLPVRFGYRARSEGR